MRSQSQLRNDKYIKMIFNMYLSVVSVDSLVLSQGGHPFLTPKFQDIFVFFKDSSCHVKGMICNDQRSLLLTAGIVGHCKLCKGPSTRKL